MSSVRLMTANLLKGGATAESLYDVLTEIKPDILAVQELTAAVAPVLRDEFPHHQLTIDPELPGVGMAASSKAPPHPHIRRIFRRKKRFCRFPT